MIVSETGTLASICKSSFYDFVLEFWHTIEAQPLIPNWHVKYLCDELQILTERVMRKEDIYDLIINIPPNSSKSVLISQMFPAWVWSRMPYAFFITASYAESISIKDSMKNRDILKSDLYRACFPNVVIRDDSDNKHLFENNIGGGRLSAGIGGSITGRHAHFIIVDDPLNPKEAASDAQLKVCHDWFKDTIPSRRQKPIIKYPMILVQQRLHQADPSGELLDRKEGEGIPIKHICLPGELTDRVNPPELASKYVDGVLDANRAPMSSLKALQSIMGAYQYAAQVLQHPIPLGGGLFQIQQIALHRDIPGNLVRWIRSWDKAGTQGDGDWSVGCLMAKDVGGYYWILDVVRGQWDAAKREAIIRQTAEQDGDDVEIRIEIEGGSGGKESGENTMRNLAGFRVTKHHPTGDKVTRAHAFASQVGAKNVHMLMGAWNKDFLEELAYFPYSRNDDQVDAASSAFNLLAREKIIIGGFGRSRR